MLGVIKEIIPYLAFFAFVFIVSYIVVKEDKSEV